MVVSLLPGVLLVGATVTEGIFNIPGVGNTLYQAAIRGEGPTVVSFVTVFVILYVLLLTIRKRLEDTHAQVEQLHLALED